VEHAVLDGRLRAAKLAAQADGDGVKGVGAEQRNERGGLAALGNAQQVRSGLDVGTIR
jgi:hypothetical protein